jgi:hypothetical protein
LKLERGKGLEGNIKIKLKTDVYCPSEGDIMQFGIYVKRFQKLSSSSFRVDPEDLGYHFIRNICKFLTVYMAFTSQKAAKILHFYNRPEMLAFLLSFKFQIKYLCIGYIYYRQHNKQLVVMVFTTICFDSHESSSGYVQNLLVLVLLLLRVLEVVGRYDVVAVLTLI